MARVAIKRMLVDESGRLRIMPDVSDPRAYEHIYRAAMSVRWDAASRSLLVLPVQGNTPADEFNQIAAAVQSEYGDELVISSTTTLEGLPDDFVNRLSKRQQPHDET